MIKEQIFYFLSKIVASLKLLTRSWEDEGLILQAKNLMASEDWNSSIKTSGRIEDKEFRVYSQFGDDGIIQFLVNTIGITNKYFIEFGVADFYESNKSELINKVDLSAEYVDANFRISRDKKGVLNYIQPNRIIEDMRGLKVYNIETNELEEF